MEQDVVLNDEHGDKELKTRHQKMLAKLDAFIPWPSLARAAGMRRGKAGDDRGTYERSAMLRIYVLQILCGLSDLDMVDHLHLLLPMRQFVGLGEADSIPEESAILQFRKLLEKRGADRRILKIASMHLARQGIGRREITDVLVLPSPVFVETTGGRDPEMDQGGKEETGGAQ